jgi:8-oxo-dGTP pyrophosphatase MutT (NUDIX family)
MQAKWSTRRSKVVIKDRWIHVRADDCVTPGGREISPYYVLSYPDWVHVVAITPDEQVVLTRQYRHAAGQVFWELPGGALDGADLDPVDAARRELEEETGYRAERLELVSTLYPNPATHTNRVHTYLAVGAAPVGVQRLDAGEEGLEVHLMPRRDVVDQVQSGLLGQALHTSSILMALLKGGWIGKL